MITIATAVASIVKSSPLLAEGMSRGLLNVSAVARSITPKVEEFTKKQVSEAAVMMTLKRMQDSLPRQMHVDIPSDLPDIVIRSNLAEVTFENSDTLTKSQQKLLALTADYRSGHFMTITTGVFETSIVASQKLIPAIMNLLAHEKHLDTADDLASLTVRLTPAMIDELGSYAKVMRKLAWEGINIVDVVSTRSELTIIVHSEDADTAFATLRA